MVVIEVLPLLEAVVEQLGVVDDDAFELAVELFAVDAVGSLHCGRGLKSRVCLGRLRSCLPT
jgi:hypothetical protein